VVFTVNSVERANGGVRHGWLNYHERVWVAGHVADRLNVSGVSLEEGFNEEGRISRTKHPDEVTVGVDEGGGIV
jgi:hypothetical protein